MSNQEPIEKAKECGVCWGTGKISINDDMDEIDCVYCHNAGSLHPSETTQSPNTINDNSQLSKNAPDCELAVNWERALFNKMVSNTKESVEEMYSDFMDKNTDELDGISLFTAGFNAAIQSQSSSLTKLREALESIVSDYEGDGMENMNRRDECIYQTAKLALNLK